MNLRQVEAFVLTMELGSVTRAAEAMAITQSAASRLVLRLQDEVGFALFRKVAGRLQATPEGQALFEEARRAFLGLREVEIAAQRIREVGTGNLHVCVMPTLAQGLLPERIASFHRAHPGTAITLDVRPNSDVIPAVRGGSSELGFAALPIADPTMQTLPVARNPLVCILPPGHPLGTKSRIEPEDLREVPYVGVPRVGFRRELDAIFAARSVIRRVLVETRTMTAAASLVANGVGATIVDPLCLVNFTPDALIQRPFYPQVEVEVGVLWSSTRPLSQVARRFLRHSGWLEA